MAEGAVLEVQSAVVAATAVNRKHDISFLSHVQVPSTGIVEAVVMNQLGMRTTVYIDDGRVFLVRVEVDRFDKTVVEVCLSVGRFQCTQCDFRQVVVFNQRVGSGQQYGSLLSVGR